MPEHHKVRAEKTAKGIYQSDGMKAIGLADHPEGGRFREVFRSVRTVSIPNGVTRSALTHIYFALQPGEVSRFHKVASDEVWNLYQGTGIHFDNCFCHVVPAGIWQAAEPISEPVLVGCSVAPGFEFSDFKMMDPNCAEAEILAALAPEMAGFIVS